MLDTLGPTQSELPANHVQHVNAHVTDDPVAVLHETPAKNGDGPIRCRVASVPAPSTPRSPNGRAESVVGRILASCACGSSSRLRMRDVAEQSRIDDFLFRFDQMRRAAPLRADLHDATGVARGSRAWLCSRGRRRRSAFARKRPPRLRPRRSSASACQWSGVPIRHDVKIFLGKQLLVVRVGARPFLGDLATGEQIGCLVPACSSRRHTARPLPPVQCSSTAADHTCRTIRSRSNRRVGPKFSPAA